MQPSHQSLCHLLSRGMSNHLRHLINLLSFAWSNTRPLCSPYFPHLNSRFIPIAAPDVLLSLVRRLRSACPTAVQSTSPLEYHLIGIFGTIR